MEKEMMTEKEGKAKAFNKNYLYIGIAVVVIILGFVLFNNSSMKPSDTQTQEPSSIISGPTWHEIAMMDGSALKSSVFEIKGKLRLSYTVDRTVEHAVFPIYVYEEGESIIYADSHYADYGFKVSKTVESTLSPGKYYVKVVPANINSWNIKIEDYY